jgi:hypothetical protein
MVSVVLVIFKPEKLFYFGYDRLALAFATVSRSLISLTCFIYCPFSETTPIWAEKGDKISPRRG